MADVKSVPEGYHTVTPYLIIRGAAGALEFYQKAFGATELFRMPAPGGTIGHAEIQIGDSRIMLADEALDMGYRSPQAIGGTSVSIMLYVPDVDSMAAQAKAAGATEIEEVTDKFYGDRSGTFEDPFGHRWHISTHKEDVPMEEMERRMKELFPS